MVAHYKNQDILLDFEVKRSKVKVMARPNTVTKTERHIRRRVLCSFDYILVIFRWNSFSESANTFVSLFHSKLKAYLFHKSFPASTVHAPSLGLTYGLCAGFGFYTQRFSF